MIYVIGIEGSAPVKIGHGEDPTKRVGALQTGSPHRLSLLWMSEGGPDLEGHLHATFSKYRVRGEWFDLTPLGDPVTVIREAVANAPERLLPAPRRIRQATPDYSVLRRHLPISHASHPLWPPQGGSSGDAFGERPQDWDERFPPVTHTPQPAERNATARSWKGQDAEPGCIRAWQGKCHRPANTSCGCGEGATS